MKRFINKLKRDREPFGFGAESQTLINTTVQEIETTELENIIEKTNELCDRMKRMMDKAERHQSLIDENAELKREQVILQEQKRNSEEYLDSLSIPQPLEESEFKSVNRAIMNHSQARENELQDLKQNLERMDETDNYTLKRFQDRLQDPGHSSSILKLQNDFERLMSNTSRRTPSKKEWEEIWINEKTRMDQEENNLNDMIKNLRNRQMETMKRSAEINEEQQLLEQQNQNLRNQKDDYDVQLFRQTNEANEELQKLNLLNDAINHRRQFS